MTDQAWATELAATLMTRSGITYEEALHSMGLKPRVEIILAALAKRDAERDKTRDGETLDKVLRGLAFAAKGEPSNADHS